MELIVISPTRLKIMLTEPDMRRYALSADTAGCADGETRRSLRRLFDDARKETGFETEGARLLIQLYASRTGGCEIFVTKLGDQNAETEALSAPEEALLRRVFGNAPSGSGEGRAVSPEPARLTSSCPTCVGVPAPAETATRRTAVLLPDMETLLRVCRRLSGLGYAQCLHTGRRGMLPVPAGSGHNLLPPAACFCFPDRVRTGDRCRPPVRLSVRAWCATVRMRRGRGAGEVM